MENTKSAKIAKKTKTVSKNIIVEASSQDKPIETQHVEPQHVESQPVEPQQVETQQVETQQEIKLVDILVKDENTALNVMVGFLNVAHKRGAFLIDESAKIWECIQKFQK
jgi:hypothetical protein